MKSVNKCTFIGNCGADPEVRYTGSGKAVANVSIACTQKFKDNEHTEWVRLVFWDKLAEIVQQYVNKGDPIYVEGEWRTRKWQDQQGTDHYMTECHVRDLVMLGGNRGESGGAAGPRRPPAQERPAQQEAPIDDGFDDIPF